VSDARRARLTRPPSTPPAAALVGAVVPDALAALRVAGWGLRGLLMPSPFAGAPAADAVGYLDVEELLDDERVDAAVVDGGDPTAASLLPQLRAGGLLVLLPTAAPLDVDLLRAARAVPGTATAVGLVQRWEPWARTASAAAPLAGVPVQVTVRGWPPGPSAAAELVDLVATWCGEVVAAVAAPGPLPALRLSGGEPVAWAVLTSSGATVLVSHEGAGPVARLSTDAARLVAGPAGVRWEGGADVPLLETPPWVPPAPRGTTIGAVATAAALAGATGDRDVAVVPAPADLGDLLVAARVLEALRTSARTEREVEVA
jgi:hypothetical protein